MSERTLVLGIDTSIEGDLVLAQLHEDGRISQLASRQFSGRHQSTELMPNLRQLLAETNATLADLRAIIVVHGPGSFTGLRIGLSAAKGLAEAASLPIIAISSLEALSFGADKETIAVLQAGRAEYYLRRTNGFETLEAQPDLAALTKHRPVIVADEKLAQLFPGAVSVTVCATGAWQAILAALPRVLASDFDDTATLDANYVRRPYTEIAKPAK